MNCDELVIDVDVVQMADACAFGPLLETVGDYDAKL